MEIEHIIGVIAFSILILSMLYKFSYFMFVLILSQLNIAFLFRKIKPEYLPFVKKHFEFYNRLNLKNKQIFERRVQLFIDSKQFIPRGGEKVVSPEIKALVAGSAIQITFGFPKLYFPHFNKILIYPDNYYSTITKQYHQGEVNVRGLIVLSETNLIAGWADETDGRNLGLHEMAHAFNIDNLIKNSSYKYIDTNSLIRFKELAKIEHSKIKQGEESLFRAYSASNLQEFFAVCVENFFEKTDEFSNYNSQLYSVMVRILRLAPKRLNSVRL